MSEKPNNSGDATLVQRCCDPAPPERVGEDEEAQADDLERVREVLSFLRYRSRHHPSDKPNADALARVLSHTEAMTRALEEIAGKEEPPFPDWEFFGRAEDREKAIKARARAALDALEGKG